MPTTSVKLRESRNLSGLGYIYRNPLSSAIFSASFSWHLALVVALWFLKVI